MPTETPTRREATVADLYRARGKAELVNGVIVLMSPTGYLPGRASARLWKSLSNYEDAHGGGYAIPDNVGLVVNLPGRKSFSPDAAWHPGPPTVGRFLDGAPVFAVEVRSEGDYGARADRAIARKRADYFAAGTRIVWDVDVLQDEVIRAFSADSPDTPRLFRRGETADAEPAVPGWTFAVADLFEA